MRWGCGAGLTQATERFGRLEQTHIPRLGREGWTPPQSAAFATPRLTRQKVGPAPEVVHVTEEGEAHKAHKVASVEDLRAWAGEVVRARLEEQLVLPPLLLALLWRGRALRRRR